MPVFGRVTVCHLQKLVLALVCVVSLFFFPSVCIFSSFVHQQDNEFALTGKFLVSGCGRWGRWAGTQRGR